MIITDLLNVFFDPHMWAGANGFAIRIMQHLMLTCGVVAIAAVIAIPLGIWIGHTGKGVGFVGAVAGSGRAIPTLGLLTLLGLWLGIGLRAPVIALVVLAIPSLLAASYSGIADVDMQYRDAAIAVGYTSWQVVMTVEIPLAASVIIGGIRSTVLQVISTSTLVAYISDWGLGRYIFTGLALRDYNQMFAGSVLVTILAIISEISMSAIQRTIKRKILEK